jgi:hypothetical protein
MVEKIIVQQFPNVAFFTCQNLNICGSQIEIARICNVVRLLIIWNVTIISREKYLIIN